jgi:phage shock protein PspC (stress-responsive transcriptional regulator)
MKKNFSVNIGSRLFNIDEDAYERLLGYLGRLRLFFASEEGREEILTDIEMRISELLEQKKTDGSAIITLQQIDEVIAGMGEPGQLSGSQGEPSREKAKGKLYRDPDNRQVGGVCAGIAAWFGTDPLWIRIVFALITLMYGTGAIIYLILWIILPEAVTTSEKLEMQRRIINIGTLRNEVASASKGLRKTGSSFMQSLGTFIRFITEIIARLFKFLFQLLRRVAGALILLFVLILFVGISLGYLVREPIEFGMYHLGATTISHGFEWLLPGAAVRWQAYIALALLLTGIVGLLIFAGLRLLLKWPPIRAQVLSLLALLVLAGIIIAGSAIHQYSRTIDQVSSTSGRQTHAFKFNKIRLIPGSQDRDQYWAPLSGKSKSGRNNDVLGEIRLSIRPAPGDSLIVTTIKSATALQENRAAEFAKDIEHSYQFQDTMIVIDPYFRLPYRDGMHYQKTEIIIGIPLNKEVLIKDEWNWHINYNDFIDGMQGEGSYIMTSSGLKQKQVIHLQANDTIQSSVKKQRD